ncbi:MAG: YesL family protein [Clostridia bacterium]|nr:YesL family protein [Clostridia bacterium]
MKKFFSMDSPFMTALSVAADLLVLNILTVLVSLPLITSGAAIIAMHSIVIKIVRQEECYIIKPFFKEFASNIKKGMLLSLIMIVAGVAVYFDYRAAKEYAPKMRAVAIAVGIIALAIMFYAFALTARYENTFGATMKNAVILSIAYFPRTLIMVLFAVGLWFVCVHVYRIGVPVLAMFGVSLPCYINLLFVDKVFHKLEGDSTDENRDDA